MSDQYNHEDDELTGQLGSSNSPCNPKLLSIVQISSGHLKGIQVLYTTQIPAFFFFLIALKREYHSVLTEFLFKTMQK